MKYYFFYKQRDTSQYYLTLKDINTYMKIKRNLGSFKIRVANKRRYVYPDFKSSYIRVNGEKFKDCCLELKVSNKMNRKYEKKHILQCAKYSTKSRKPVILFYLFHFKKAGNFNQFSAISKVFMIKAY